MKNRLFLVALVAAAIFAFCITSFGADAKNSALCNYLESLRVKDGTYAFPGQDVGHLTATYAAVVTYDLIDEKVPGNRDALANRIATSLYPIYGDRYTQRTRWHSQTLYEYAYQQARAILALGKKIPPPVFNPISMRKEVVKSVLPYEVNKNPIFIQELSKLTAKDLLRLPILDETKRSFEEFLDPRERANGSYNTTASADGSDGHIVNTYYALEARRILQGKINTNVVEWIRSCQKTDGGFTWCPKPSMGDCSDIFYAHGAVKSLKLLGGSVRDEAALKKWLSSLRNADGGFGDRLGAESCPLATMRAVEIALALGWKEILSDCAVPKGRSSADEEIPDDLKAWTIQFQAPGYGSVREAVEAARRLKIHFWGVKNSSEAWIKAAREEAKRRGVPVVFFVSNESYGKTYEVSGVGKFNHLDDPVIAPDGTRTELLQIMDHECCGRILLDSGRYDYIGTFHFGCHDMTWILPYLYCYSRSVPFVANQDSHGETWWWRGMLKNFRTVFLAKECTWDAFREACAKGRVVSIREDAHTEGKLRIIGGTKAAREAVLSRREQWTPDAHYDDISVQLIKPEDVFETARPKTGCVIRVRTDRKWEESKGLQDGVFNLVEAKQGGKALTIDRKVFRHEKKDYMHNVVKEAYDLVTPITTDPVFLKFEPGAKIIRIDVK